MDKDFAAVSEEVRRLEKKAIEYAPYSGDMAIEKELELEPKELVDLSFADMLNLYERAQKVISAKASLDALAAREAGIGDKEEEKGVDEAERAKVESELLERNSQALAQAEETGKGISELEKVSEEPEAGKERPAPPEEAGSQAIEFEEMPTPAKKKDDDLQIEFESVDDLGGRDEKEPEEEERHEPEIPDEEPFLEIELEREEKEEKPRKMEPIAPEKEEKEAPAAPKPEPKPPERKEERAPPMTAPPQKRIVVASVPPQLQESPDKLASDKYRQIEQSISETLGEGADEVAIKKRMLALTKDLFREKLTSRREAIKLEITALKNMLTKSPAKGGARKQAQAKAPEPAAGLLDTLVATQESEIIKAKDSVVESYEKQLKAMRGKFREEIEAVKDDKKRNELFEAFVFSVMSLQEQLPQVVEKYRDFNSKKHLAEIDAFLSSESGKDAAALKKARARRKGIEEGYQQSFASMSSMIVKEIDLAIELAGRRALKKAKRSDKVEKEFEVMAEIDSTSDETLMNYLLSKDPDGYKRYEKREMSAAEARMRAKALMAQDKGLAKSRISRFFSLEEA